MGTGRSTRMLEVRHLTKVYSGKGGVDVRALDDVSVVFPEKGMVFLLGKSGSGKSTLLNITGGLDKPDSGEIIVKGRSSKDFSAADFDSYRNTFIGFVFQEYNILNEFTIEQNIALALQLQSKPNDKAAVDALLAQVGMEGYGKRKPNTLSGGQKQRVAIARALIKQPEIIMADEPTGALDSTTGKQVLDTLKELSKEKLIIVVSHDRDFAEFYGDRIIELKDGKVISDVTKTFSEAPDNTENVTLVSDDTITVKKGEDITDEDVRRIAEMLRQNGGEAVITAGKRELPDVKRACRINDTGAKESFKDTGPVEAVPYDGKDTKFIKSRLPMSHAVKMGAGSLKTKPIRLIFTIILAVAAFVLFGVVSTFMLYDPSFSISEGLKEAGYADLVLQKDYSYIRTDVYVDNATGEERTEVDDETHTLATLFGASELAEKNKNGLNFAGVFTFDQNTYRGSETAMVGVLKEGDSYSPNVTDARDYYCLSGLVGFTDCGETYLTDNGFRITGKYPAAPTEIMLSEYVAEMFALTEDNGVARKEDLVGKKVRLNGLTFNSVEFTVSGIVYTGEIPEKYNDLKTPGNEKDPARQTLKKAMEDYVYHSFEALIYVSSDFYDTYSDHVRKNNYQQDLPTKDVRKLRIDSYEIYEDSAEYSSTRSYTDKGLEKYGLSSLVFRTVDGKVVEEPTIGEKEVYLSQYKYDELIGTYIGSHIFDPKLDPAAYEELGSYSSFWYGSDDSKNGASYEKKIRALEKWYRTLGYRGYLFDNRNSIYMSIRNKTDIWREAYDSFCGFNDLDYLGTENETDLELLQRYVNDHLQVYYGWLVQTGRYSDWSYPFLDPGEDIDGVINKLKYGGYTAEEFAAKKVKLDDWFVDIDLSTDVRDHFSFDTKSDDPSIFLYCLTKQEKVLLSTFDKIEKYLYSDPNKSDDVVALTDEDWAIIESYLESHPQTYYYLLLQKNIETDQEDVTFGEENRWIVLNHLQAGEYSESDFAAVKAEIDAWLTAQGKSTDLKDHFVFNVLDSMDSLHYLDKNGNRGELKILGYIENANYFYLKESFLLAHGEPEGQSYYSMMSTNYVEPEDIKYNYIISRTDNSQEQISVALAAEGDVVYSINNLVAKELDSFLEMIKDLGEIFLYVGIGVGFIAAMFLLNFISVSISAKRKDIGILRAVGARGSDVFKIFYAEAFIIAFICFVLACVGSFFVCFFLNRSISAAISLSLLNFGPINIALIFGVSIFVSLIATFFPVYFAAKKSPVESIRAL